MSRRKQETIKQYDLRRIEEELGNERPPHIIGDEKFCAAMVAAGYELVELDEVRE